MNILEAKEIGNQIRNDENDPDASWINVLQSKHYYAEVEQRVVRQLIQALIYENILSYEYLDGAASNSACAFLLEGKTPDGQIVRYHCPGRFKDSFGLAKLDKGPIVRLSGDSEPRPTSLQDVFAEIVRQIPHAEHLTAFMNELEQTLLKDLQAQSQPRPIRLPAAQRGYDELEGDIMDAHLYHPCYKSRIGFTLNDNRLYGPEFKQLLQVNWIAVHKMNSRMNHSARIDYRTFIEQELGDPDYRCFASVLQQQNKNIDDYWLMPVHPWQWQERIIPLFHPELVKQDIVWLGAGQDNYRAQQSIRTLANYSAKQKAYIKLSLSITNTSSSRILAAHTVMNGPIVTDWLQGLIEWDSYAKELDFVILGEVLGVSYDYGSMPENRKLKAYGTLGAIWRESLHRYLRQGESAAPFNGLCHVEDDGRPLIDTWMRQHGLRAWTEQLLHVTASPIIHMLFGHGIGMESHAQNIMLIHKDGWPVRIALKDFHDGVRFSPRHLAYPEHCPELVPVPASHARINRNSFILTDDLDAVRDFSCDSFFFICLGELAIFLAQHYELPEKEFWSMTATVIREYQMRHPQHEARFKAFDVFAQTFQVEELTKRRLLGDSEPRFKKVPNPLHAFRLSSC
ncbi:MAG: IucA/IucC family siderophore biosynthesis protein [Gammaproteobacteria bacterium]|nr:IucA/IucC family siderophore biosynthesis protein [Gammaproteobacteria bacterium]